MRTESAADFIAKLRTLALLSAIIGLCATAAAQLIAPTVGVADHSELGEILVDGEGRALYAFTRDQDGESTCYGGCEQAWPPLLVDGQVGFAPAVDLGVLGTTERNDGTRQLTYAGHPLYYHSQDAESGDVNGQGVDDVWFLLRPSGDLVETAALGTGQELREEVQLSVLLEEGADVFMDICAACHGQNGEGTRNAPSLVGHHLLDNESRIARQVMFGGEMMPGFGSRLSNREVAAVLTFVRNSWGNDFGVISEAEVMSFR